MARACGGSNALSVFVIEAAGQHDLRPFPGRLPGPQLTLKLLHNSALVAINLIHVREVGVDHVIATGRSAKTVEWPLPYGSFHLNCVGHSGD